MRLSAMSLINPAATTVPSFFGRTPETISPQAGPTVREILFRWCRQPLFALLLTPLFASVRAGETDDGPILQFGEQKQLLVDDHVIAEKHQLARRLGRPLKVNDGRPVIVDDTPWEDFGVPIVGSVLREDGRFRIWYRAAGSGGDSATFCYAESRDGVRWVKPQLGLVEFDGSRANNIYQIGRPQVYCPFVDPNEKDPRHKYKAAVGAEKGHGTTTALAYSPDGLRWSYYDQGRPITGRAADTINQVLWDPYAGVYRLYTRTDYGTGGGKGEIRGTRDMVNPWTELRSHPGDWTTVREWCLGRESGRKDYEWTRQIYSLNGWIYESVQFGLLWSLERPGDSEEMDFFLATTRGDRPWNLEWVYRNQPFLTRGPAGSFDAKWIQPAPNIVTWKDKHWIYYVGRPISHSGQGGAGAPTGIGLATVPLDRFVSLTASDRLGWATTRPFRVEGEEVEVNLEVPNGELTVEVLNADGEPIPGFSRAEALVLRQVDGLRVPVRWKNRRDLSRLRGRVVKLRLWLRRGSVYAFRICRNRIPQGRVKLALRPGGRGGGRRPRP